MKNIIANINSNEELFEFKGIPVTTYDPMFEDRVVYKLYIVLKDNECNIEEIRAVAKACNINFITAKSKLTNKKTLIAQGDAYDIRDILRKILQYDVNFSIEPPYPYDYNKD